MRKKYIALRVATLAIGIIGGMTFSYLANAQEQEKNSQGRATEAFAEKMRTDKYAVFDSITEDGGNLRQVLAGLDIVTDVIPLGPNVTYVHANSGAGLLRGGILDSKMIELRENIPRICRGEWFDEVMQKDIMSDRVVTVKRKIPAGDLKQYFARSSAYGWKMASCGEAFVYRGSAEDAIIYHKVQQPFVWKNDDLLEPKSKDDLPADGLIPMSWFKPKERYPSRLDTIAWANRICELRGGRLSMAFNRDVVVGGRRERQPVVVTALEEMVDQEPQDYYLHCDARAESFLVRKYVDTVKSAVFTNTFDVERMAVQRNRDLKSVGF